MLQEVGFELGLELVREPEMVDLLMKDTEMVVSLQEIVGRDLRG